MYSAGKPVDLQKQTQTYVYKEIVITFVFTIVQTYIIALLLKSKDMAVNFINYAAALNEARNQLQISRSVSNESDSAYSDSSCENNPSIPDNQILDYSSESYCSLEFSEGNSPVISTFSQKSSLTSSLDSGYDEVDCAPRQLKQDVCQREYSQQCPVFTFNEPCSTPEDIEVQRSESAVTPGDLVHLINNNEAVLLLDCRSFMAYNSNHITGSFNINCSDRITKKRLSDGKIQIVDVICGQEGKDLYKKHESNACIIVCDEGTVDLKGLAPTQPLKILTDCLTKQNKVCKFLQGGLSAFQQTYSHLCTNPEPVSNLPILFSPTSPELNVDIDAAVVSEVLPQVLIGNQRDAADRERLRELGVTHIINVTSQLPLNFENDGIIYKRLPASDNGSQNLKQYFEEAIGFIDGAVEAGGRVLVHCQAGVSRSPTIVIAYLMARSQRTLADAFSFVKERRAIVAPNLNFMGQLLEFEQKTVQPAGLCPPSNSASLLCL